MDFDELKEIVKEQWDVVLYIVMFGLILGWALLVTLVLPAMGDEMKTITRTQYHKKRTLSGLSSEVYRDRLGNLGAAVTADQIFVNASAGDFRLKTGSPAIGMGVPISGISTDFAGQPRDPSHPSIGAYEGEGGPSSGVPAVIQEVPTSGGGSTQVPTPTEVVQASSGGSGIGGAFGTAALIFGLGFLFVVLTD